MRHLGLSRLLILALVVPLSSAIAPTSAHACGCFAPPDPITSILQSGERIIFSVMNGQVTANIQIQYSGAAADFGWLLPLPSVPTLEVSSDEVFAGLTKATVPDYRMAVKYANGCFPPQDLGSRPDFGTDTSTVRVPTGFPVPSAT